MSLSLQYPDKVYNKEDHGREEGLDTSLSIDFDTFTVFQIVYVTSHIPSASPFDGAIISSTAGSPSGC